LIIRCLIGGLFIYAGAIKIGNPQSFADSIETFKLLPAYLIGIVALGLPPFEVIMGTLLIVGRYKRVAALAILFLSVIFAIAILQGLIRGLPIDCGCLGGGAPSEAKAWISLFRDLLLILASWFLYRREVMNGILLIPRNFF